MAKLEDAHRDLLKLILRTAADDAGWRKVSNACCGLFTQADFPSSSTPPELFEFEKLENGGRVRLTERGAIVADYI